MEKKRKPVLSNQFSVFSFHKLIVAVIMIIIATPMRAQFDPTLAAMIAMYTDKAENTLKSQQKAMALEATGHIWIKEEMDGVYQLQKQYNEYLDNFRSIVVYAAQIYGFYHEISRLTDNIGDFANQFKNTPTNALAVALSTKRNAIYRELIYGSLDICNDIRQVCMSDIKMTEKQRIEIVFNIRPKLRLMNQKLRRLTLTVKYTTLGDVWREIDLRTREYDVDKDKITDQAYQRWRALGRVGLTRK